MGENVLENSAVKLRAPEPTDLETLYTWENNTEIWPVSNTVAPFSRFALRRYIEKAHLDIWATKQLRLIIEAKEQNPPVGIPVGLIDLFDFDPYHQRAGVGVLIAGKEHRQKGYASEALGLLIRYGFEVIELTQLYSNIRGGNTASLRLFEAKGFERVGVKRAWLKTRHGWEDEVMLQLINPALRVPKG